MRKSIVSSSEDLKNLLLEVGTIVDSFSRNDHSVLKIWEEWLKKAEEVLKKYNYSESSEIAGLRSQLLIVDQNSKKKVSKRKSSMQRYIKTIDPAQTVVLHLQKSLELKIENTREVIRQLIGAANQLELIGFLESSDLNLLINNLFFKIKRNEQLGPVLNNAITTFGKFDVIRLFAEELTLKED